MGGNIISSKSKLFAIIGDPITHCMSPVIMNSSFRRLGLDNVFVAMHCAVEDIDVVMKALRAINLSGYVVTMPLKERVVPYLDEMRDEAEISGVVNCIQNDNGRLIGHNTDSKGFWAAIQEKNTDAHPIKVDNLFILGMGGLAKAVAIQAAMQGVCNITAANRIEDVLFVESFKVFSKKLCAKFPQVKMTFLPWEPNKWKANLADADVIINVTPNGLESTDTLSTEFPYENAPQKALFFDSPAVMTTPFLQKAEKRGHRVINGVELNAHQGVYAFEIMTGHSVQYQDMRNDALMYLRENGS